MSLDGKERDLVEAAYQELRKMDGSRTMAKDLLAVALDPTKPVWEAARDGAGKP